jgi:hypothetical protein
MKIDSVGQILASRILDLKDGRSVNVILGSPQRFPDGNEDYFCTFQILGMGDERIRYGAGVDPFQALWLTLQMIGAYVYTSDEAKNDRLTWLGQKNLGFPVSESIGHLVPKGGESPGTP